jgi:dienelactone hydrolase
MSEDLRIPMVAAGAEGLEAVLVKPDGPGRHPLALISHGSPRDANDRAGMTARSMMPQLTEFARRGFVAVAVLRRGYGSSPGGWAESYGPCADPDYLKAGRAGAADLKTAISVLSRRGDVDARKIIAVGVSAGGFATVALTADPPPGLVAAISFAGGRGSRGPDDVCGDDRLVAAYHAFGMRSRVPMLWVYAANDHFFDPPLARRLLQAFTAAGGTAEFATAPAFGDEGHYLFSAKGIPIWTRFVDTYLRAKNLMPAPPVATGPRLQPPRQLSAKGRVDFETYLDAATHKAFAVSATGAYAWRTARATIKDATEAALANCEAAGHRPCRLYAIDDDYAQR